MTTNDHGSTPLLVEGPLTIYEAAAVKERLLAALAASPRLRIDLAAVDEFDTAGLQLLVLAQREAVRAGGAIDLVAVGAAVEDVLVRYGLAGTFGPPPPGTDRGGVNARSLS